MALKIRLARAGAKKRPQYRIVVADSRMPRDGRFLEKLGTYNPLKPVGSPERVTLKAERIVYWLGMGAKPTDRVGRLLGAAEIIPMPARRDNPEKAKPKAKAQERLAAEAEAAKAAAEAPAKEPAAEAPAEEPTAETAAEEPTAEAAAEEPAAEAAAEEPATEAPAEEPATEAPAEEPAAEAPAEEPAAETAAEEPAAEAPAEESAAEAPAEADKAAVPEADKA